MSKTINSKPQHPSIAKSQKSDLNDADIMPEELGELKIEPIPKYGGGLGAIKSSLQHLHAETGLVKGTKLMLNANQINGFDCPGCAWPDPDEKRSFAEFCENGAKAIAEEASNKRVTPDFFAKNSVKELLKKDDFWLGKQGRLTHPMVLYSNSTHYQPIHWEKAFQMIANQIQKHDSPHESIFYTSGRTSNEAAFLYQLMVRTIGTNNLPDCSNMCHESSGQALKQSIGIGKGTVTLDDFNKSDLIVIIGQNPGTNHPRMLSSLQSAVRNGAHIITINPLLETANRRFQHPQEPWSFLGSGTKLSHLHLPVKINGDVATFQGINKLLIEMDKQGSVIDWNFLNNYCDGHKQYLEQLEATSWDEILQSSGLLMDHIHRAAELVCRSKSIICCWAMGLTQHENAIANIQEVVHFLAIRGNLGRPGSGVCPVRGHSNVQGDRTMGIWERPSTEFLDNLKKNFNFNPPREPGLNTVEAIQSMLDKKVKLMLAMGGNFLSASPDTNQTAQALQHLDLSVQISTKLNRSHLVTGKQALILPCLGRSEIDIQKHGKQFQSVENSMGVVHSTQGNLKPASPHLKSEISIVCELANEILGNSPVNWMELRENYNRIRNLISKCIPGFDNYNQKIKQKYGFYLPNPVRDSKEFPTSNGKVNFFYHSIPEWKLAKDRYLMMTIRSHDQFNTTIYGLDDRYRGIKGDRRVLLMNIQDMQDAKLVAEQVINIRSHYKGQLRQVNNFRVIPYEIPRGCCASYFPEANPLVPLKYNAKGSMTPASKSIVIEILSVLSI